MADEDLQVRASLEDDLTGPLRHVEDAVEDTSSAVRRLDRRSASAGTNGLAKLARGASGALKVVGRGLYGAAKLGAAGLGLIVAAAAVGGSKLVSLASDAEETASKFATVFAGNSAEVSRWVRETNAAFGLTTQSLQDVTSRFGVFGKAAGIAPAELQGFSTSLAQAGLDLSSFYNVDPEEAFTALSSGLAGEAEPLRRFGIFLSDATMKAEAASMGLTGELTEAQKVMVRHRLILKNLGDANGDLARTSDSVANKGRALKGRLTELATQAGRILTPVVGRLFTWLDDRLAPIVVKLTDQAGNLGQALTDVLDDGDWQGVAEVVDNLLGNTGRWVDPILEVGRLIEGVRGQLPNLGGAIRDAVSLGDWQGVAEVVDAMLGNTGALVGPIRTAGETVSGIVDKAKQVGQDVLTIWRDGIAPALEELGPAADVVLSPMRQLDDVLGWVADNIETLRPLITAVVAGYVAWTAASAVAAAAQWALNGAAAANPYVIAAAAIVAVAVGVWQLWKHCKAARPIIVAVGLALASALLGPIVWIIAGLVLAYKKVDWFRNAVNALGRFLKTAGAGALRFLGSAFRWLGDVAGRVADGLAAGWQFVQRAVESLTPWVEKVVQVFRVVAGISLAPLILGLAGAWQTVQTLWEKAEPAREVLAAIAGYAMHTIKGAIQWLVDTASDLWDKADPVRQVLEDIGALTLETIKSALRWIGEKIDTIAGAATGLIDTLGNVPGAGIVKGIIGGDTPRPRAAGAARRGGHGARGSYHGRADAGANLRRSMARHAAIDRLVPGRRVVTSSLRTWALGSPGSDHATGRAWDLRGSNLNTYAQRVRDAGGFAEHHGSGAGRHLHVAMGDTARPRARAAMADGGDGGTLIIIEAGAVVVDRPASTVDLKRAIAEGIAEYDRDRRERGARRP